VGEAGDFAGTDNGVTAAFFTASESALASVSAGLALFFPGRLASVRGLVLVLVFVILAEGDAEAESDGDSKDEAGDADPLDFGFGVDFGFPFGFPLRKKLPNVRWLGGTSFFVRDWDLVDFFLAGEGEAVAAGMVFAVAGALL